MTNLITPTDICPIDGEPTIQDTRLAELLGYAQPRDIRILIQRHEEQLVNFGLKRVTVTRLGKTRQQATVYHLNLEQACYIATKSETPNAIALTVDMVRVFTAYKRGELTPPADDEGEKVRMVLLQLTRERANQPTVRDMIRDVVREEVTATIRAEFEAFATAQQPVKALPAPVGDAHTLAAHHKKIVREEHGLSRYHAEQLLCALYNVADENSALKGRLKRFAELTLSEVA